jgi:glycosyltransferase involved in cell wall biosynthesis
MLTASSHDREVRSGKVSRRPLRIGLVAPLIAKSATGLSSYVADLVPRLCDAGHRVTVLGSDCGYQGTYAGELIRLDERADFNNFSVQGKLDRRIYRSTEMTQWLGTHARNFDVVDIQGVWSWIAADAANVCKAASVPYIITPHGMMTRWDWAKQRVAKEMFFASKFRSAWRNAAVVRYLSVGELQHSRMLPKSPHIIIPNAVEVPTVMDAGEAKRKVNESLNIPAEAPVILFLGRVTDQKGVLELLTAFEAVRGQRENTHLVIAGPVEGEYGEMVKQRAQATPGDAVHILGPVYGDLKFALFSRATMFVTLSKNEGLSITALEALSMGVPVVVTKDSNLPEVESANAGVTTTCDPARAAADIAALLDDSERRAIMQLNAIELVKKCFSWDAVLPRLVDLYERASSRQRFEDVSPNGRGELS